MAKWRGHFNELPKRISETPCDWHGQEIPAFRIFSLVAFEIFDVLHNADSGTFPLNVTRRRSNATQSGKWDGHYLR